MTPPFSKSHSLCSHSFQIYPCSGTLPIRSCFLILDSGITAGEWTILSKRLQQVGHPSFGLGWDLSRVSYISIAVFFDLETNTLANMEFDSCYIQSSEI